MELRKGRKMIWTLKRYWSGGGASASVAAVASARCTRRYCAQTLLILERNIHMTEKSENPAPDRAEWNAYFPSDYSLSVYTSPTTDFRGCGPPRPHPPDGRQPARLERARTACGGDTAEGSEITHKNTPAHEEVNLRGRAFSAAPAEAGNSQFWKALRSELPAQSPIGGCGRIYIM